MTILQRFEVTHKQVDPITLHFIFPLELHNS